MRLNNLSSLLSAAFYLFLAGVLVFHGLEYRFGVPRLIILVLCCAVAAYSIWDAFRSRPRTEILYRSPFLGGMGFLILAVALTFEGLGYQHHVLKVMILASLYAAATYSFWRSLQGWSASVSEDRSIK